MTNNITKVEVFPIRMPNRNPIKLSTGVLHYQDNVIVRVWAGDFYGIGETEPLAGFQGCEENHQTIVPLIRNRYTAQLIGRDPFDIANIVDVLDRTAPQNPYAKNGVVNALYDLMAKLSGLPLCEFLGRRWRDRIPVVWTVGIKDLDGMADEAKEAVAKGYKLLKLKIGGRPLEHDIANVTTVRQAVGDAVGIRVDANASLDFEEAYTILRQLAPLRLDLVEQPLDIADIDGMARLTQLNLIPIMPDESLRSIESAEEIARKGAASIFGIKLAKHGGIYDGLQIVQIARAAGIPIYPGNQPSTSIGSANAAHFFAATDIATLGGDFHIGPAGWLADDIVKQPLRIEQGFAYVPQGLGIGMDIDEEKLEKYAHRI